MKPGKTLTPIPVLDLEKLWRALREEPPGAIRNLEPREATEAENPKPDNGSA